MHEFENFSATYSKRIAISKKADRTAYDVRCRCRIEQPKMTHLDSLVQ